MTITSAHPQALQRSSLHCQPPHAAQRHLLQGRIYLSHYHGQCEAIAAAQIQAAESPENLGRFTLSLRERLRRAYLHHQRSIASVSLSTSGYLRIRGTSR
jgi:hypothetical protein